MIFPRYCEIYQDFAGLFNNHRFVIVLRKVSVTNGEKKRINQIVVKTTDSCGFWSRIKKTV